MTTSQRNSITVSLTVDDYIAAHRLHQQQQLRNCCIGCFALLAVGVALKLSGVNTPAEAIIFGALCGLFGAWWQDRRYLPRKVTKLYRQFKGIESLRTISWTDNSIEGESASGHGHDKATLIL